MLTLLTGLAVAAAPPGVDLDDVPHWEAAAERILDGPAGCWEMVGHATWSWDVGRWGASRGDAVFVGRLEDGVWSEFHVEPLGEVVRKGKRDPENLEYGKELRFAPLVGKLEVRRMWTRRNRKNEETERALQPENLVRSALDRLGADVTTSWAQWDDEAGGVVLYRAVPLTDGARAPEAQVQTLFPGGEPVPVSLDLVFPKRFHKGAFPRWRLEDAVVHVRARSNRGQAFPTLESFKFEFGVLGFTFTGAQTIRYKSAKRCPVPGAEVPDVAADVPAAPPPAPAPAPDPPPADDVVVDQSPM